MSGPKAIERRIDAVEERFDRRVDHVRERARREVKRLRRDERDKIRAIRAAADAHRLSDDGVRFIASWEGLRLTAYLDVAGVWTIGYGHTGSVDGRPVGPGMRISKAKALDLLRQDVGTAVAAVRRLVTVKVSQRRFDVLVSFTFNCGTGALASSTLLRLLNQGKYGAVPAELMKWVNAGGVPVQGLINRRRAEAAKWKRG